MTSRKQIEANRKNARESTGPKNCEITRFNPIKYGLTSESFFSKEDEKAVNTIYDDLSQVLVPQDRLQEWVLGRIATIIWRLQKSTHIEQKQLKNSLIRARNEEKVSSITYDDLSKALGGEDEMIGEKIDTSIDLIMRYEVTNENRVIKLINFFKQLQR